MASHAQISMQCRRERGPLHVGCTDIEDRDRGGSIEVLLLHMDILTSLLTAYEVIRSAGPRAR